MFSAGIGVVFFLNCWSRSRVFKNAGVGVGSRSRFFKIAGVGVGSRSRFFKTAGVGVGILKNLPTPQPWLKASFQPCDDCLSPAGQQTVISRANRTKLLQFVQIIAVLCR